MRTQTIWLTVWLATPIVLIVGLTVWIIVSMRSPSPMSAASPVGAGAGDSGGDNALKEMMSSGIEGYLQDQMKDATEGINAENQGTVPAHTLGRGLRVVVIESSGAAYGGRPLRVAWQGRDPVQMMQDQDGSWVRVLNADSIDREESLLLTFTILDGTETLIEMVGEGVRAQPHAAPLVNPALLEQSQVPIASYLVTRFAVDAAKN